MYDDCVFLLFRTAKRVKILAVNTEKYDIGICKILRPTPHGWATNIKFANIQIMFDRLIKHKKWDNLYKRNYKSTFCTFLHYLLH